MKFEYKGREAEFSTLTGIVISSQRHSETHVTSSGGGGYVGSNGGYVSAPTVSSYAIDCHDFWLKTTSGEEVSVQLRGMNIPLREGQKVVMLLVKKPKHSAKYAALINKTTNKYFILANAKELTAWAHLYEYVNPAEFIGMVIGAWLMLCIPAYGASFFMRESTTEIATFLTAVFMGYRVISRIFYFFKNIEVENVFMQKVNQVCQSI